MHDVVIVGGGPAGLAAALVLGRSRKRVTVFDGGDARNAAASHVHCFVTRDGASPDELRSFARADLERYPSVEVRDVRVQTVERSSGHFVVTHEHGRLETRKILLCTGLVDELPDLPHVRTLWGSCVFQCPYCHAWEVRDRRFAYWPRDESELDHAVLLRSWTSDVVVFSNGAPTPAAIRRDYERANIRLDERRIVGLRVRDDRLAAIEVEGGEVERDVLFCNPVSRPPALVSALGLRMFDANSVFIDDHRETSVSGIYAAGDLVMPVHNAMIAAADAIAVAFKVNTVVTKEILHELGKLPSD